MSPLVLVVVAVSLAVAVYLILEQRRHGADMAARGGLNRRQFLVLALVPLSLSIVETVLFIDDGEGVRLFFAAIGYLLAAWLITRAFATEHR